MIIEPHIIETEDPYRTCLAEVERLAAHDPAPGTPEGDQLERLATLVEDYEKAQFKLNKPEPDRC